MADIIHVNTQRSYDIYVGKKIFSSGILDFIQKRSVAIITDKTVKDLYYNSLVESIKQYNPKEILLYTISNGEKDKNINTAVDIISFLSSHNFEGKDILIALGGGVIGDLTGFVASIYHRGIVYIQIPTTLLSMVDSSIGGKTAVDTEFGKNIIGSFWQPSMVLCNMDFVRDFSSDLIKDGMAEIVKYYAIEGEKSLLQLQKGISLEEMIKHCMEVKSKIVSIDEFDQKERKILNAGHTFAHALEKASDFQISHGKAVAQGLLFESYLAHYLKVCNSSFTLILNDVIAKYCRSNIQLLYYKNEDLMKAMLHDKKNSNNLITFSLLDGNGNFQIRQVKNEKLLELYNQFVLSTYFLK